jgi:DNA-binding winged helix-turn-helix (wHTH) protein/lipoprotein NlpI
MESLSAQTFTFNEFTLDLTRGCLFRNGEEIKLRPKSFDTLRHLVENSGRLISKNELIEAVWPGTAVTDDSLVQCLIEVRRALGEDGQQIVKTVPRRGYIFDAPVIRNDSTPAKLIYTDEVKAVRVTIEEAETEISTATERRWVHSRAALALAALLAAMLAGLGFWQLKRTQPEASNSLAYSYYTKGMYHFHNIRPALSNRSDSDLAVDLFKKAIELDPQYALAHAYLGYTYTKIAVFHEDNPTLIEQAKRELGVAEKINPQLAEVHLARFFIAFSQYEGWSVEKAIRELRLAQQLDPNVGHAEMGDLYSHIGLEEQTTKVLEQALKIDPNNEDAKITYINALMIAGRPDEALEASKRFFKRQPDVRYFLEKRMLEEAEEEAEQEYKRHPDAVWIVIDQILLKALRGKHEEAQAEIPLILSKERRYRGYHHDTYNIARIYALGSKANEALKWLRTTVAEGFPHYPLFARDRFLDPIRDDPSFQQFLGETKERWERYVREVESNSQAIQVRK